MAQQRKRIGEILLDAGVVTEFQISTALNEQKRWGGKLAENLVRLGYITEEAMLDALRDQLKVPTVNLKKTQIPPEVIKKIPEDLIRKHRTLPVSEKKIGKKDYLIIAMDNPTDLQVIDELQFATKLNIMPALAGPITLDRAIKYYLDHDGELFEVGEQQKYAPSNIRDRVDITDGTRTVMGDGLSDAPGHHAPSAPTPPPRPAVNPHQIDGWKDEDNEISEVPGMATMETGDVDLAQLRAELSAMRDLLLEKGIIDRKAFVAEVMKTKKKS